MAEAGVRWNRMRMIAVGLAAAGMGCLLTISCDRSAGTTNVAPRSTTEAGPTTEKIAEQSKQEVRRDLAPIPQLGVPEAVNRGHDEVWAKYKNGMMIYVLRPGNGITPHVGQTVHVYYKGYFPNGQVFDQSGKDENGKPKTFEFTLGTKGIIKGWNIAIATMQVGGKIKVYIPADLAYGSHGALPKIAPNQPLIFEIELVDVTGMPVDLPDESSSTESAAGKLKSLQAGPSTQATQPK